MTERGPQQCPRGSEGEGVMRPEPGSAQWCRAIGQRQWQEVVHRKLRLNVRENFLTVQVSEYGNRLPREDVRLPSLETGELSGCNLMSCALGWPCWNRGVTPDDHCGPFQLGPFCEE